ncbi:MAG TPA: hypothetical protein VJR50_24715, partial [Mycobacterium sp.]|nr:hypothetical protein [Mycobacterium sp.]
MATARRSFPTTVDAAVAHVLPPVGGFRFGLLTIPPQTSAAEQDISNVEDAVADLESKLPGLLRYMD